LLPDRRYERLCQRHQTIKHELGRIDLVRHHGTGNDSSYIAQARYAIGNRSKSLPIRSDRIAINLKGLSTIWYRYTTANDLPTVHYPCDCLCG